MWHKFRWYKKRQLRLLRPYNSYNTFNYQYIVFVCPHNEIVFFAFEVGTRLGSFLIILPNRYLPSKFWYFLIFLRNRNILDLGVLFFSPYMFLLILGVFLLVHLIGT